MSGLAGPPINGPAWSVQFMRGPGNQWWPVIVAFCMGLQKVSGLKLTGQPNNQQGSCLCLITECARTRLLRKQHTRPPDTLDLDMPPRVICHGLPFRHRVDKRVQQRIHDIALASLRLALLVGVFHPPVVERAVRPQITLVLTQLQLLPQLQRLLGCLLDPSCERSVGLLNDSRHILTLSLRGHNRRIRVLQHASPPVLPKPP